MVDFEHPDLPEIPSRSEGIEILLSMGPEHFELFEKAARKPKDKFHPVHHVVATALKRSMALTRAFLGLVDDGNEFAALPCIRMQLDSVLRLSAFRIVSDPCGLASHMLKGNSPAKFDKKNFDLSDAGLRRTLAGRYEFLSAVYEETSGYVHLSNLHLIRVVEGWEKLPKSEDEEIRLSEVDELPAWSEDHKRESLVLFCSATKYLLEEASELMQMELPPCPDESERDD